MRVVLLTAMALVCFAGNSLLCRLALADGHIDAASFTAIRLASGAVILFALVAVRTRALALPSGSWLSAVALFAYAAPFSFAYVRIGAAIGALILFACVQATMIGWGVARGERPRPLAWVGIAVALGGLVALTLPGHGAPDLWGSALMAVAGAAWGVYSLRGRTGGGDPVTAAASSFVRSVPLVAVLVAAMAAVLEPHASMRGVALAVASGAIASGIGYAVWYTALPALTATRAAVLQLLVPILAAAGASALLDEQLSLRFAAASAAILGGVALTLLRPAAR